MNGFKQTFALGFVLAFFWTGNALADIWTLEPSDQGVSANAQSQNALGNPNLGPHQAARLDVNALDALLAGVPMENLTGIRRADAVAEMVLSLPTPDGNFENFSIVESPVMEPGLAQWLADRGWPMRTFAARSLSRPGVTARLDWGGPNGLHAVVQSSNSTYYVDPQTPGELTRYVSYHKQDNQPDQPLQCEVGEHELLPMQNPGSDTLARGASTQGNLRTYRLAYAVTGDYTTGLAGGSVVTAQANVVTIINRVNSIYERELSVRLIIIEDNPDIIYADGATDPYSQNSASAMLSENQSNINAVIGSSNYDIGHVMYRGSSGVASVFAPCGSRKARGVSGVWRATGDSIVVDMIAHEMGHQFGALHTFNSPIGNCAGSNWTPNSAWEPGSGTTIMSYSGICGSDNIQNFSNDYFHAGSLEDMLDFIDGSGSCAATISATNLNEPVVTATGGYTLPIGTPFELDIDSVEDADGDTMSFTWEQMDLGAQATIAAGDQGDNPIVRSLPPGTETSRVVDGSRFGDTLPATTRTLNFRFTARDNNPGGGRLGEANIVLNVDGNSGPFAVSFPNGGESFTTSDEPEVTWDVAGTDLAPVDTATVDILLSTDGGLNYDRVLASDVPNDGAQIVTLPDVATPTARIKVRAADNIYFDVSNNNFAIDAFEQCVTPEIPIPQFTPVSADLVVSGQDGLSISDLDVRLDVTYPRVGFLVATIEHLESGTSARLISRPGVDEQADPDPFGCERGDINAIFDDEASADAESACALTAPALAGRLTPTEPLSVFDDIPLNGTWRVTVRESTWSSSGANAFNGFCIQAPLNSNTSDQPLLFKSGFEEGEGGG